MSASPQSEREQLRAVQRRFAAVSSSGWCRAHDGVSDLLEARAEMGELQRLARFDDAASAAEMDFLAASHDDVGFLLGLVDRAIKKLQPAPSNEAADEPEALQKNFAAEAGILCSDGRFQTFLAIHHGLERPADAERTAQKLRSLLVISSRRDLNDDDAAAARWRKLRGEFQAWKRAER